ncbi:MAG: PrsW family intramembrane metalloprotease [bacterium]|nr:PrsW family intramembrane metalloprotease [bacterium]
MTLYVLFFACVSAGWLLFFGRQSDHLRPATLWLVFGAGLLSGPVAGATSALVESLTIAPNAYSGARAAGNYAAPAIFDLQAFLLYFLIVGPVEEIAKFLAVFFAGLRRSDFRTSNDGIVLGIAAALGFACGENILYLLAFGPGQTLPRLILGNLGHAAFAVFWGYALGAVLHENANAALIVAGLLIASLFHGAYNYLLGYSMPGALLAFALSGALYSFMFRFLRGERNRNRGRPRGL